MAQSSEGNGKGGRKNVLLDASNSHGGIVDETVNAQAVCTKESTVPGDAGTTTPTLTAGQNAYEIESNKDEAERPQLPEYVVRILEKYKQRVQTPVSFHPAALLLPFMTEKAFVEMRDDIAAHGQREPIIMIDGQIGDGRMRYLACLDSGTIPSFKEWDGKGSLVDYVVSANLHRRHLSDDQRACVAAAIQNYLATQSKHERAVNAAGARHGATSLEVPGAPKQRARARAAEALNVSQAKVRKAEEVRKASPALLEEVKSGRLPLSKAHAQSKPGRAADDTLLAALHAVERKLARLHPESMGEERLQSLLARTQSISDFHEAGMCRLKELQEAKKPVSPTAVDNIK